MARRWYSAWELARFAECPLAEFLYWQEIGLLTPRASPADGAERYDDVSLLRLQQIRIGRARGLALEEIRRWLALCARDGSCAWDELCALQTRVALPTPRTLYLETEVKAETPVDRAAFQREAAELYRSLCDRWRSGAAAPDGSLKPWVERHRLHISRWFCPCEPRTHAAFARAIVNNPQLAASIERHGHDLPPFMLRAIEAHAH